MAIATLDQRTHHGDPVVSLAPGGPIPDMRSGPFALLVSPDLAAYFLTLNVSNRVLKPVTAKYASDMKEGAWRYPAEALHFMPDGRLGNGQNRLTAVTWSKVATWFRVEFGWPELSLDVTDIGSSRSMAEQMRRHAIPSSNTAAATLVLVAKYDETAGTARSWMNSTEANYVPSVPAAIESYQADELSWAEAVRRGNSTYAALEHGLTGSIWAAAYYIAARTDHEAAAAFFDALCNSGGSELPAVQALREHAVRRSLKMYRTGDRREPLENVLRAFQAFRKSERPGFVRSGGFRLTVVR
jgi:hypothetical protein